MSDTIEVDGDEYELSDNPSLRTVREVQSMQMGLIRDHLSEDDLKNMDSLEDESAIIDAILESGGTEALQDVMWERSMLETVQTISLAADEAFESSDFDDLGAKDYKEYKEKAEEVLGGDASDFFTGLGVNMSLNEAQMEAQA
jgi:hypothetical protein